MSSVAIESSCIWNKQEKNMQNNSDQYIVYVIIK